MSSAATARVNIIVGALDHASKNVSGIIAGLTKKVALFNRLFQKKLKPRVEISDAQKELNKLSFKKAGRNINQGVNTAQRKINSLTAGNAPNRIAKSFNQSFARIQRQAEHLKKTIQNIANVTIAAYGLEDFGKKLANSLKAPVEAGMNFEAAMSKVSAVTLSALRKQDKEANTNVAAQALESLTVKAREIGAATKWSATQIAEGMSFLGMAGMKAEEILVSMRGVANLAAAGGIDLARAADIASNVATAMGKDAANQMSRLGDVMAHTITNFNVNMSMLGETMKYAAPIAEKTGVSLETLSAAAGVLGNSGIQASMAGTTLRKVLTRLASPPKRATEALERLGVATYEIDKATGARNLRKFPDILKDIAIAMDKQKLGTATRTGLMADIAGLTAVSGFATLVSSAGKGDLQIAIKKMGKDGEKIVGTAQAVSSEMINNLKGDLTILGSVTEALKISIYSTIQPILRVIVKGITNVTGKMNDWIQAHKPLVKKILMVTSAIAGAAIGIGIFLHSVGAALLIFGVLKMALVSIAALSAPLIALAGVGLLIYRYWKPLKSFFAGFVEGFKQSFAPVMPILQVFAVLLSPITEAFAKLFVPVKHGTAALLQFGNAGHFVGSIIGGLIATVIKAVQTLGRWISHGIAILATFKWPYFSEFKLPDLNSLVLFGSAIISAIGQGITLRAAQLGQILKNAFSIALVVAAVSFSQIGTVINNALMRGFTAIKLRLPTLRLPNLSDFTGIGIAIIATISKGIALAKQAFWNSVLGVFAFILPLFPSSDAKTGPFSRLTFFGSRIITTIASGILLQAGLLGESIKNVFAIAWAVLAAGISELVSDNLQQGLASLSSVQIPKINLPALDLSEYLFLGVCRTAADLC